MIFSGSNLPRMPPSQGLEGCQDACIENENCSAYTYNRKQGVCFLKSGHGERMASSGAQSGIVIRIDPEVANLERPYVSPTKIHTTIQAIIDGYSPPASKFSEQTWRELKQKAKASHRELLAQSNEKLREISLGEMVYRFKNPISRSDEDQINGSAASSFTDYWVLVNNEHMAALINLEANSDQYGNVKAEAIDRVREKFEFALNSARYKLGDDHPKLGFIMNDIAVLIRPAVFEDDKDKVKAERRRHHLHETAAQLLSRATASTFDERRSIAKHTISALLSTAIADSCFSKWDGNPGPSESRAKLLLQSAQIHLSLLGPQLEQVGLLRKASNCVAKNEDAIRILLAAFHVSEQLDHSLAKAIVLMELGLRYLEAGKTNVAKALFIEAIRVHVSKLKTETSLVGFDDGQPYEFGSAENVKIRTAWEALWKLRIDDALDYFLARELKRQFANKVSQSNVGKSVVAGLFQILEETERFDLADQSYSYYAIGNVVDGLLDFVTEFPDDMAAQATERGLATAQKHGDRKGAYLALSHLTDLYGRLNRSAMSLKSAREAYKIKKYDNIVVDYKEIDDVVTSRLVAFEEEQGNLGEKSNTLIKSLHEKLQKYCRGTLPDDAYFIEVDAFSVFELLADQNLLQQVLSNGAIEQYVACFEKHLVHLEDTVTSRSRPVLRHVSLFNVFFVLGKLNKKAKAIELLSYLLRGEIWAADLSDQSLLRFERSHQVDQSLKINLPQRRSHFINRKLIAISWAINGLVLSEKTEWTAQFDEDLQFLVEQATKTPPKMEEEDTLVAPGELAMSFEGMGKHAASQRLFRHFDEWAFAGCTDVSVCEFLAHLEFKRGNKKLAEDYAQTALNTFIVENTGASISPVESEMLTNLLFDQAKLHLFLGRYALARAYFKRASRDFLGRKAALSPLQSQNSIAAQSGIAQAYYAENKLEEARAISSEFVSATQDDLHSADVVDNTAVLLGWSYRLRDLFEVHLNTTPGTTGPWLKGDDDAFFAMQMLQTGRTAATFSKIADRIKLQNTPEIREQQDLNAEIDANYKKLLDLEGSDAKDMVASIEVLEAKEKGLAQTIEEKSTDRSRSFTTLQFPNLIRTQALLKPGEAMLVSYDGDEHPYLWLLTRSDQQLLRLNVSPEKLEKGVRILRRLAEPENRDKPVNAKLLHSFYRLMLKPFESKLVDINKLIFVPHGAFDGLPISALVTAKPPADKIAVDELRASNLAWLARRFSVSIVPSVASLRILRESGVEVSSAPKPFLGVGNADFGQGIKVANPDGRGGRIYPAAQLPETADELRQIAGLMSVDQQSDLLLDGDATEANLKKRDLSQYQILAFATHGLIAGELRTLDEPALALTTPNTLTETDDGLLRASEVVDLKLNADLVFLSACNTAAGDGRPGAEGLSGLANAFLYAGARNLIATHWYIPSDSAVEMAVGMMKAKQASPKQGWSEALRTAQLALIDEKGPPSFAHPVNWAAHIVVGIPQ